MNFIFNTLLKSFGWQRLLLLAWNTAYPSIKKMAADSANQLDDVALQILNQFIVEITGSPADIKKPAELKTVV